MPDSFLVAKRVLTLVGLAVWPRSAAPALRLPHAQEIWTYTLPSAYVSLPFCMEPRFDTCANAVWLVGPANAVWLVGPLASVAATAVLHALH